MRGQGGPYRVIRLAVPAGLVLGSQAHAEELERELNKAARRLEPGTYRLVGIEGFQCAVFAVARPAVG